MARTPDPTAKIALLSAAESVFAEKGVEAAKVEDITRRAGLSKGAFYLHFESKEEALKQICETFLAHCVGAFISPEDTPNLPTDPGELLAFWLERDGAVFELLWQNKATVAILQSCQGPHLYLLQAFDERVRATSQKWIEFWKRRGLFRADVDAELTSHFVFGAYNRLALRMLEAPKKPRIGAWLQHAQELLVRGLGTDTLVSAFERHARHHGETNGRRAR
jgi:AcrR family transcriptional regulator